MTGGGSGSGSSTGNSTSTTTQSGPPAQVLKSYQELVDAAKGVATQPLNLYTGSMVAGFTPQQQKGFTEVDNAQGIGTPYINAAAQEYGAATTPLWDNLPKYSSDEIGKYMSPYTEDVTKSLTNLYNEQNQEQQQEVQGNATLKGAFGGDREAVAQALLAKQQNLAQAPVLAQVQQTGFTNAQDEFNKQQASQLSADQANAWLSSQAGAGMAALGKEAQDQSLTGANALLTSGALQQKLAQEELNIPYQQFLQTQAYPYQSLSFLAPIIEGTGSLSGGTGGTSGTTKTPGPSTLSTIGGLGLSGLGLYGLGKNFLGGGSFNNVDAGGTDIGADTSGYWANKRGGRIGYADGGITLPDVPGIGSEIPDIDLSWIPTGGSGGVSSGILSPFQADVTSTTTSGGGGGGGEGGSTLGSIVGGASQAAGLVNAGMAIASFLARGGRVYRADGGGVGATFPEPERDIRAQVLALSASDHPKDAVFIAIGNEGAIPQELPDGVIAVHRAEGTLLTTSHDKAAAFSQKGHLSERDMAQILGYSQDKDSAIASGHPIGVRAMDPHGNVISDAVASPDRLGEMAGAMAGHGALSFASPQQMIGRRAGHEFAAGGDVTGVETEKRRSGWGAFDIPPVPKINLDFITHPGPAVKGAGPPKAPSAPTVQQPEQKGVAGDLSSLMGSAKQVKGLLDDTTSEHEARGGGIGHFQMGGEAGLAGAGSVPISAAINFGGAPPNQSQSYQQLMQLPLSRLMQMAVQFPETTSQGQLVQKAIRQKQMTPGSGTAQQAAPAAGGEAAGYADGGSAGFVTEGELDPYPEVDHSGDTVKVRYPSEGRVLDLGLPSIRTRRLAAGGSSGTFPHASAANGKWSVDAAGLDTEDGGKESAVAAPLLGTSDAETPTGTAASFLSSLTAKNGVKIPQLSSSLYADPTGLEGGGGIGQWLVPRPQYQPAGSGPIGPNNTMRFPSQAAYVPQMSSVFGAFYPDNEIPAYFGGTGTGSTATTATTTTPAVTPTDDILTQLIATAQTPDLVNSSSGDKRGGRIGYDDGGEVVASEEIPPPYEPAASAVIPSLALEGDYIEPPTKRKDEVLKPFGESERREETPFGVGGLGAHHTKKTGERLAVSADIPSDDFSGVAGAEFEPVKKPPPRTPDPLTWTATQGRRGGDLAEGLYSKAKDWYNQAPVQPSGPAMTYEAPFTPKVPERSGIGADPSGLGAPQTYQPAFTPRGGIGEPAAPAAMVAPTRQPPTSGQLRANPDGTWTDLKNGKNLGTKLPPLLAGPAPAMPEPAPVAPSTPAAGVVPQETSTPGGTNGIAPSGAPAGAEGYGPVAAAAVAEADRQGVPRSLVLKAAQVESGMGTNLGSRGNVLQLGKPEWEAIGGGNMSDLGTQVRNGVAWLKKSQSEAQRALGREPQDWETYIVHQQGSGGGPALLTAPPDKSAVDVLAPIYGNRQTAMLAIVGNGGDLNMTAGQFLESVKGRFEGYGGRLNLKGELARSGPDEVVRGDRGAATATPAAAQEPLQKASNIARTALSNTPPEHRSAMQEWMNSPWFLAFLAGAGMLASKSPFPGVALGEGLQSAAKGAETMANMQNKQEVAQIRAQHLNDIAGVRSTSAASQAALAEARLESLNKNRENLLQQGQDKIAIAAANSESKHLKDMMDTSIALAKLEEARRSHGETEEQRRISNDLKERLAQMTRSAREPLHIPNSYDETTGQVGTVIIPRDDQGMPILNDPSKRTFIPGGPKQTGQLTEQQYAQDLTKMAQQDPMYMTDPTGAMKRAQKAMSAINIHPPAKGTSAPTGKPAGGAPSSAIAPTSPATPALPIWAKGTPYQASDGKPIFTDGTGWFYADHTPYQTSP